MTSKKLGLSLSVWIMLSLLLTASFTITPAAAVAKGQSGRYIAKAKSAADYNELRNEATKSGATIVTDLPELNTLVVQASADSQVQLSGSLHLESLAKDQVRTLIQPEGMQTVTALKQGKLPERTRISLDPASSLPGLMWNLDRIHTQEAWKYTTGKPSVIVGVADTGLDYTHSELASQVLDVVNLTDPTLCKDYYDLSDSDLPAYFGVPANIAPVNGDWNGHGSWIGGNIAGALDGKGINGIAPNTKLVALKISEWCGSAYDSSILNAFLYAADHGIDVVSISFGGYLDRSDPEQDAIYKAYEDVVEYAWQKGTVIVAAAGNEHLRIGEGGKVLSHGPLTTPGTSVGNFYDYYGLYEVPGGIKHVVDVSATGNLVNKSSASCPTGSTTYPNAVCKPTSDSHQPAGAGKKNQLTYYSNYGSRIDIAAPGGARKFNLPNYDGGGTPGYPVTTADGTTAWEDFSITSNWATQIPCDWIDNPNFYQNECYSTIQGTSMATPHVSAVIALTASYNPSIRHNPAKLVAAVKAGATEVEGNTTQPLSATDTSAGDLTGLPCPTGYCHLGGKAISDREAYGAGLVNALGAILESKRYSGRNSD
ncbi:S8 family serine peptidase [Candidatus Chlorohelix sp.]|uniref:S8 family serine peptidase n=1 Tax=Candidatus Chlorohelix sp. TaxID=3139201 RepID=UPI00305CFE5F